MWMFRNKQKMQESSSLKYAICSTHLAQNLFGKYEQFQNKTFTNFDPDGMEFNEVLGIMGNATLAWSECEGALLPVNIGNEHWVAVAINFQEQQLHVYNSLKGPKIRGQLLPLTTMIPILLNSVGFYDQRKPQREVDKAWPVKVEKTSKQEGAGDCGIFCIKFIEFLAFGKDIKQVRSEEMDTFRKQLALMLFGTAKPTDKQ